MPEPDPETAETVETAGTPRRPGTRPLWTVVLALLLGAAALWGSSKLPFVEVIGPAGDRTVNGAEAEGWHIPHAVLALTAVAAALAVSGWARRLLGVLLFAAACWQVYATLDGLAFGDPVTAGHAAGADSNATVAVVGPMVALLGALLVAAAGALLAARGHAMPRLGSRYSAPGAKKVAEDPDVALWDSLSEGDDPTRGS